MEKIIYEYKGGSIIAEGFRFGSQVIYVPLPFQKIRYGSDWWLLHLPTELHLAKFLSEDYRLGLAVGRIIQGWDWRGNPENAISRDTRQKWGRLYRELRLDKTHLDLSQERYQERKATRQQERKAQKQADSGQTTLPLNDSVVQLFK